MALWIRETYVNESKGYQYGDSEWYETFTDDKGRLFRSLQRDYGRCMSRMYVDTDKGAKAIGWVFWKRQQYEDAPRLRRRGEDDTYIQETWVEVRELADDQKMVKRSRWEVVTA